MWKDGDAWPAVAPLEQHSMCLEDLEIFNSNILSLRHKSSPVTASDALCIRGRIRQRSFESALLSLHRSVRNSQVYCHRNEWIDLR